MASSGGELLALAVRVAELTDLCIDLLRALAREGFARREPGLQLREALALLAEVLQLLGEPRLTEVELLFRGGDLRGTQVEVRRPGSVVAVEGARVVAFRKRRRQLDAQIALAIQGRRQLASKGIGLGRVLDVDDDRLGLDRLGCLRLGLSFCLGRRLGIDLRR